jgi:hypothetical protein
VAPRIQPKPKAKKRAHTRKAPKEPVVSQAVGTLIGLDAARLVVVHDTWFGMHPDAPFAASYELRRNERGALVGEVRQFKRGRFERSQEIALSAAATTKFLRLLADAEVLPGPYAPFIGHTDDFPSIQVAVHVGPEAHPDGIVLVYSSSQGEFHAPWSVSVRGESFTSPGDEIGRALAMVRDLVRDAPDDAELKAHARHLVDRMDEEFRPTRKPGEVMSRKEAVAWGGEELGPMIYRLANSKSGGRKKPSGTRKKTR